MSIGQRIALLVVIAVGFGMALYALFNVRARRAEILTDAFAESTELGTTLDVVLNEVLASHELSELGHLPDQISRAPRTSGLAIYDARDRSLVISSAAAPSRARVRALAERAVATERASVQSLTFGAFDTAAYSFPLRRRGGPVIGAAVLLRDVSYMGPLIATSRNRIVVAGLILALLMVTVVLTYTRVSVAKPVAVLIDAVRHIGEGELSRPVPIHSRDEIGQIAKALNQVMRDLGAAREQIRADVESRIALEKSVEFERRIQHAQRLAAVGQVAASLAHEIGSPLHVIAGRARFAAGRDDAEAMRENLLVIATQADRITRVVEQMLSVARRRRPRIERIGIANVASTVLELLGPQARQQKIELSLVERQPGAYTTGDPDGVQQVLFNLVLNAIQAQPDGGAVEVYIDAIEERDSLGSPRARTVIEVRDQGPGIPAEDRETVFEPFKTSREGSGGTGLGLAVVREIVREHAGTIRVMEATGAGAVFRVSFPREDESGAYAPLRA